MLALNLRNLRDQHQGGLLLLDLFMLALVTVNLLWLLFDSLFASHWIRSGLTTIAPGFTEFYATTIHPDYVSFDLIFVGIYISEFVLRWLLAIVRRTHYRWFFYPFVHWYDLLGCIPLGSFRWLRLLRVVAILYRLQRSGVIDLSQTVMGRFVQRYYNVLVEEASDRVVENVLQGIKAELREGGPVFDQIVRDVIAPHKPEISGWLVSKINAVCDDVYLPRQQAFQRYIREQVAVAIEADPKATVLDAVPVLGSRTLDVINHTVSEVVFRVIDQVLVDVGREETDYVVGELVETALGHMLEPGEHVTEASKLVLSDIIDLVIKQVRVQRWKTEVETPAATTGTSPS